MKNQYSVKEKPKKAQPDRGRLVQAWIPSDDWDFLHELAVESRDMKISPYLRRLISDHLKKERDVRSQHTKNRRSR